MAKPEALDQNSQVIEAHPANHDYWEFQKDSNYRSGYDAYEPSGYDAYDPPHRIQENMTVREFMELLEKNGMSQDAQALNEMLENMHSMDATFRSMRDRISELETEVSNLRGATPLTDQFKTELATRCEQLRDTYNGITDRFRETGASIVSTAREGVSKFAEIGKSALHRACSGIANLGINYLEYSVGKAMLDNQRHENLLERMDELSKANNEKRLARGNFARALFGSSQVKTEASQRNEPILNKIRAVIKEQVSANDKIITFGMDKLDQLEAFRDRHKEAAEKSPAFDNMLKNAQERASKLKENVVDMFKNRGQGGPSL